MDDCGGVVEAENHYLKKGIVGGGGKSPAVYGLRDGAARNLCRRASGQTRKVHWFPFRVILAFEHGAPGYAAAFPRTCFTKAVADEQVRLLQRREVAATLDSENRSTR